MRLDLHTITVFSIVEFSGVAAGVLAGALEARRNRTYHYDLIGVLGLAVITALGGGILALLFGFSASPHMSRFIWIADAASLGLFSVAGVIHLHPWRHISHRRARLYHWEHLHHHRDTGWRLQW
jgi:uncharacterized membrane protein YeiH